MKSTLALFLAFTTVAIPTVGLTQEDDATTCNHSWLASDWAAVASECLSFAETDEAKGLSYSTQASDAPAGLPAQIVDTAMQIAEANYYFAAMARARVAIGYLKLKRKSLYATELQSALEDLSATKAMRGMDRSIYSRAVTLKSFIQSPLFPIDAADSDLLAHI